MFEEVSNAQVRERTNLLFASREFPDVIFAAAVNDRLLWDAAQAGDVWPLNELVDRHAPNWKRAIEERAVIRKAITMPDGKFYSLPYYREILNDYGSRDIQAINVDWRNSSTPGRTTISASRHPTAGDADLSGCSRPLRRQLTGLLIRRMGSGPV